MQVDYFLGMNDLGLSRVVIVIELDSTLRHPCVVFYQEKENRIASRNFVTVAQPLLLHGQSVHQGTVAAVQILDLKAAVFLPPQQAVLARDRRIDDRDRVGWIPAQVCGS